jgi:hypothetical protein
MHHVTRSPLTPRAISLQRSLLRDSADGVVSVCVLAVTLGPGDISEALTTGSGA